MLNSQSLFGILDRSVKQKNRNINCYYWKFVFGKKREKKRAAPAPGGGGGGVQRYCIINLHFMIQTHNMDVDTWLTILTISLNLNPYYGFEL